MHVVSVVVRWSSMHVVLVVVRWSPIEALLHWKGFEQECSLNHRSPPNKIKNHLLAQPLNFADHNQTDSF